MIKSWLFRALSVLLMVGVLAACGPQPRLAEDEDAPVEDILSPDEADPVVARVNGTVIRRSDVEREFIAQDDDALDATTMTPEDFDRIREELIDQRLLAMEARARGLHQSEEARRRMAQAQERILGNVLVDEVLDEAADEATLRRIYEEQIRLISLGDEVRARHLQVSTREEADAAKALLDEGADFATMAVGISLDAATRLEGGDLGYFTRAGISEPYGTIAFNLSPGEISEPFETAFGWHILKVEDRRRQPPPSFETLRPNIVRYYSFDQLEALIDSLREGGTIERVELPDPAPEEIDENPEDAE